MSREGNLTMKAKRKVKVKFQIQLQTMNNVPAALNDASIFIAWKRGGKKDNKGQSSTATVRNGSLAWSQGEPPITLQSTLIEYTMLGTFSEKTAYLIANQQVDKKKVEKLFQWELQLNDVATDGINKVVDLPLLTKPKDPKLIGAQPPVLTVRVQSEWLKINNKVIVGKAEKSAATEAAAATPNMAPGSVSSTRDSKKAGSMIVLKPSAMRKKNRAASDKDKFEYDLQTAADDDSDDDTSLATEFSEGSDSGEEDDFEDEEDSKSKGKGSMIKSNSAKDLKKNEVTKTTSAKDLKKDVIASANSALERERDEKLKKEKEEKERKEREEKERKEREDKMKREREEKERKEREDKLKRDKDEKERREREDKLKKEKEDKEKKEREDKLKKEKEDKEKRDEQARKAKEEREKKEQEERELERRQKEERDKREKMSQDEKLLLANRAIEALGEGKSPSTSASTTTTAKPQPATTAGKTQPPATEPARATTTATTKPAPTTATATAVAKPANTSTSAVAMAKPAATATTSSSGVKPVVTSSAAVAKPANTSSSAVAVAKPKDAPATGSTSSSSPAGASGSGTADKKELDDLWERFLQQVVKINNLTTENRELTENLKSIGETHKAEISRLNKSHDDEVKALQSKLDKQSVEIAQLREKVSAAASQQKGSVQSGDVDKLKSEHERQLKDVQQKLSEKTVQLAKAQEERDSLTKELKRKKEELQDAQSRVQEKGSSASKEVQELKEKLNKREQRIEELEEEVERKQEQAENLANQVKELEAASSSADDTKGKENLVQQKADKLEKMLRDVQTELVLKKQSLKKATKETDKKDKEIKALKEQLAQAKEGRNNDDSDSDEEGDRKGAKGKSDTGDGEAAEKLRKKLRALEQQLEETTTIDSAVFLSPTNPSGKMAAEVRDGLKAILRLLHDAGNDFTDERILHRLLRAFSIAIDHCRRNRDILSYQISLLGSLCVALASDDSFAEKAQLDKKLESLILGLEKNGLRLDWKVDEEVDEDTIQAQFVRQLFLLLRKSYGHLCHHLLDRVNPLLVPAVLEQPNNEGVSPRALFKKSAKTLTRGGGRPVLPSADEASFTEITYDIGLIASSMHRAGVLPAMIQQFMIGIFWTMNARMFNTLLQRPELCTCSNAFQMKYALSQLSSWVFNPDPVEERPEGEPVEQIFVDPHEIADQMAHIIEAANIILAEKVLFTKLDDINKHFRTLNFQQIRNLLLAFRPDNMAPQPVPPASQELLKKLATEESETRRVSLYLYDPFEQR